MLFKRRTAMKAGVLLGVALTYFGDSEHGADRRRDLANRAGKTLDDFGLTQWAESVRTLLHPDEKVVDLGDGQREPASEEADASS